MEKETPLPAEEVKVSTPRESDEKNNSTTTTPQSQAKSDKEQQGQSAEASLLKDEVDEVSDKQPTKAVGRGTKEIDNIDDHDASIEIQMQNDKPPPHPMSHPQNPNENNGESRPLPFSDRDQSDTGNQSRSSLTEFTEASASPGDPHHALSPQHQPFPHAAPSWPMHPVTESLQYYEAQMRDHAAAYASAAAGAAWAAAQIAAGVDSPGPLNPPMIFPNVPLPGNPPPPVIAPHDSPQHQALHSTSQAGQPGSVPQFQVPTFPPPVLPVPPPMVLPGAPQTYNFYSAPYQNQSGHNVHQYNPFRGNPAGEEDGSYYHRHRRKRQQRRRPSDSSPFEFSPSSRHSQQRSFLQSSSAHSQGSDDVTTAASVDSTEHHSGRRRKSNQVARRNSHLPSGASSSSDGHYRHNKKKPRQPTDGSLLGKSPVSALYEWCGKRKTNPVFELQEQNPETANHEFEVTVSIDSEILGKGRGGSKSAAKQDAARKALQELLPGVLFDTQSGVLIQLSQDDGKQPAAMQKREVTLPTSLDDLAPHLEKRLAIGQNSDSKSDKAAKKRKPTDATRPLHRLYSTYPGTSTTSEEEDENVYYASRGASICSTLLHAMVQIDDKIDEPPQYTFEVQNAPALATNGQKRKTSPSIASHRGSFICVGTLMLKEKELQGGEGDKTEDERIETLTASGVAATKREARHIASAKLLALLFPDCDGMVQVKEAAEAAREKYAASKAEAAREKYAASKALKQHWKRREEAPRKETSPLSQTSSDESSSRFLDAMLVSNETGSPELPSQISSHFLKALRYSQDIGQTTSRVTHESDEGQSANLTRADLYHARQLSRQRQLDDELTRALQQLNEHDEEGRVLPDELTVDDVGRTGKFSLVFAVKRADLCTLLIIGAGTNNYALLLKI